MTPGFTPEQRAAIAAYVRATANKMGLRDWYFELMYDPPPDSDAAAMMKSVYGRKVAAIWFARDFANMDPEKARHYVIHELVHAITEPITNVLENVGPRLLGHPAYGVLWEATHERSELATDQIADIIDEYLPLIDWTSTDPAPGTVWAETPSYPMEPERGDGPMLT